MVTRSIHSSLATAFTPCALAIRSRNGGIWATRHPRGRRRHGRILPCPSYTWEAPTALAIRLDRSMALGVTPAVPPSRDMIYLNRDQLKRGADRHHRGTIGLIPRVEVLPAQPGSDRSRPQTSHVEQQPFPSLHNDLCPKEAWRPRY